MKKITLFICLFLLTMQVQAKPNTKTVQKAPIQMILDSDFGSSTDDLFALMMLHHYIDEGRVDLKGIVVDREGEKNATLVDVFNTYYGHPDIPVGLERNGVKNPRCFIPYSNIVYLKNEQGAPLFPRSLDVSKCPDGYKLYRQLLSKADDNSVVVVAIGFATTLAQLFESGADEYSKLNGAELFGKKVKAVYLQAGRFESGDSLSGYNMRAASKQSAVFFSKLPKNVELIMSPSNIGDAMDYAPADVMTDLSYTELNPIKSVYVNYTCDTGQRMWDTNCLVHAVLGDDEYNQSPRGYVTFVDLGEDSQLLFKEDPNGNARYQLPFDSYVAQQKVMYIRSHNRQNRYPSALTIEAPQPQVRDHAAVEWARPRLGMLTDKYIGSHGNKVNPEDVRMLFRPVGYNGWNPNDFTEAECYMKAAIHERLRKKAEFTSDSKLLEQMDLAQAIDDAYAINASKIDHNLTPIKKGQPGVEWQKIDGKDMVLVITLVDSSRLKRFFSGEGVYSIDREMGTWVSLPVDWQKRSAEFEGLDSVAAHKRMIQMYGLDPTCDYDIMVSFYADPASMFRPAHTPEINTTEAGLEFPAYADESYMIGATNFRDWYRKSYEGAYEDDTPLPWTQLGYTYDWKHDSDHHGVSEYIVGHKALIKVKKSESVWQFIKNLK